MPVDQKMNILLVDDRPENLVALESVLENSGQNLVTATSGKEALKQVLNTDFAVILLDVQMPEMDGIETARLIRARAKSEHTPILFLTAINKQETHVTQGYSVGAVDYLFKPFEPEVLRAKVAAFVELSRKTQELKEEIFLRKQAEEEVLRLNANLERRVQRRTAELKAANRELQMEVAERKRAETNIQALNERLQRAMTETHHRVKNNLQVIAAMLDMRLMDGAPTIPADEVRRLGSYVHTLATVHDILTHQAKTDGQAHAVGAREVLQKLLHMLQETAGDRSIEYHLDNGRLSSRQATSLAFVTNELVSNAIKHGHGRVEVRLTMQEAEAALEVLDDGPGFPPGFDPSVAAHTGLELVENLSAWDLGGKVYFTNQETGGACARVIFPLDKVC